MLELDHLAVAAETLEEGRDAVETALGTRLQSGGQHAHFGTHNLLLGLEDGLYLEVIAIDPSAPAPKVPRWFDLDCFSGRARLHNWICRTGDLAGFMADNPEAGRPVALQRGDLRWQMAVPENGQLPYDNLYPAVMHWQTQDHPAARLAPSGCRLRRLTIRHPQADELSEDLKQTLTDDRIAYEAGLPALQAEFDTPFGQRSLM